MPSSQINPQLQTVVNINSNQYLVKQPQNDNMPLIDIAFENIKYTIIVPQARKKILEIPNKSQKIILDDISGIFKGGKLNVIMGTSGCGKTSLLNILSCKTPLNNPSLQNIQTQGNQKSSEQKQINKLTAQCCGKLYANQIIYNRSLFRTFACYVMQFDTLHQRLTVRETLQFAFKVQYNEQKIPEKQRNRILQNLIRELKLQKCLDTIIGGVVLKGISGGQKKRVSIAYDLIMNPSVLILDQPTSGLDSLTSYIIVRYLRKIARQQHRTIIMTIHQPNNEIFKMFDNLMLLSEGKIIYQGQSKNVQLYLEQQLNLTIPTDTNPPDFFISSVHNHIGMGEIAKTQRAKIESKSPSESSYKVNNLLGVKKPKCNKSQRSQEQSEQTTHLDDFNMFNRIYQQMIQPQIEQQISQRSKAQLKSRKIEIGILEQFGVLVSRQFKISTRNTTLLKIRFIQILFLGFFLSGLFIGIGGSDYTNSSNFTSLIGLLFFIGVHCVTLSITQVALVFPLQRSVFLREQHSRMYGVGSYFWAKNLIDLPYLVVFPMLYGIIVYWLVGLSSTAEQFFIFYLILLLNYLAGSSIGLLIGIVVKDAKHVSLMINGILLPIALFSGYLKNRNDLPQWLGWFQYVSPLKYSFTALVENQTSGIDSLIDSLYFNTSMWLSIGLLMVFVVIVRLLSWILLWKMRDRPY